MLRVESVSMRAGRAPLTFDVPHGRCLGLLSASAEDTSRLLLAAAGMARPLTGRVLISDVDSLTATDASRHRVAITRPQCVDPRLLLREYLDTVSRARRDAGVAPRASTAEVLQRLALNGARALDSSAARAEAALAAALLPAVDLVILDEAFAHVSADTRTRAIEWIRALADEPVAVLIGGREERDLRAVSHTVISMEAAR